MTFGVGVILHTLSFIPYHSRMLIHNGTLVTMGEPNQVINNGAVLIEEGRIVALGPQTRVAKRQSPGNSEQLDAGGKFILPANICAHTHFYGAFARGMAIPGRPAKNFVEVLKKLWWKLDRALDLEGVKYSTLVSLVDAIKHGTTTLIDHHASPNAIEGSLDIIANAVTQAGLRAGLCYEVTDRNGKDGARAGIVENVRFALNLRQSAIGGQLPTLAAAMGLHASFTISNATLDACVAESVGLDLPFHIHVAEDKSDEANAYAKYKQRVVQRLDEHAALDELAMLAHCIHIDQSEMELIAGSGSKVMHQPRSNMNNGVGVAPLQQMLDAGICVGLGNDGFSNDAFAEMKICDMLHKVNQLDPRAMGADKISGMMYQNNPQIADLFWPNQHVGRLAVGAPADIILLDYHPYTQLTAGNLPWHMLFGMDGGMLTHTLCNGKMLMADRKLLTLDEDEITRKAKVAATRAWKRVQELS